MNSYNDSHGLRRPGLAMLAIAALIGSLGAPMATAQSPSRPTQAPASDPTHSAAGVPPVLHHSDLRRYQGAGDAPLGSWSEANRTVNQIGGWRVYAREKLPPDRVDEQAPAPPAPTPSSPAGKRGDEGHSVQKLN